MALAKHPLAAASRLSLRGFESQWFLVPQGTGIVAVVLRRLSYRFQGLDIISYVFWGLTIALLLGMVAAYTARLMLFPGQTATALRHHAGEMDGLASIAISITSILQMAAISTVQSWGKAWGLAIYAFWWVNVAIAVLSLVIPILSAKLYASGHSAVSSSAQLPLIAALTAAAGCGNVCQYCLISSQLQVPAIVVSYLLVGSSLPLALIMNAFVFSNALDKTRDRPHNVCQDMILCGPWGQGSFALQGLGKAVMSGSFAAYNRGVLITSQAASVVAFTSIFSGLLIWGTGTFWWMYAVFSALRGGYSCLSARNFAFGPEVWSLVFPWGVYTNAAIELGTLLDSTAFKVWSTVLALALVIMWLVLVLFTFSDILRKRISVHEDHSDGNHRAEETA